MFLLIALYAVSATNTAIYGLCIAASLQQEIPACVRYVVTLCNAA